jgi:hypothetical protein
MDRYTSSLHPIPNYANQHPRFMPPSCLVRSRKTITEHVRRALCAGGDGHTFPKHHDGRRYRRGQGRVYWDILEGLEEYPGARRGTSESEVSFLLRMGVVDGA